jgi:hypothetical protein
VRIAKSASDNTASLPAITMYVGLTGACTAADGIRSATRPAHRAVG